jgi:hypothetical protein
MPNAVETVFQSISSKLWPNGSAPGNVADALDALAAAIKSSGPTPPSSVFHRDGFVASNGQTVFLLSSAPTQVASITMSINGVIQNPATDYTVIGNTLTFIPVTTQDKMQAGWFVLVSYV